ncbi:MAG: transposase [Candidatus Gracilibacteria bacterium]|nr:transposase [Candidatus Gracilibacteria bacterium]
MRRYYEIYSDTFYHIYNKGFDSQTVFHGPKDYERFINTIIRYQNEFNEIILYSYCLMPNHFHLLIKENSIEGPTKIPDFMRKIQNSYAKYFNLKYNKKGPVFIGRYNAKPVNNDNYLQMAIVYINFNPIKHKFVDNITDWQYTSYNYLTGIKSNNLTPVLNSTDNLQYSFKEIYNRYILEDLTPVLLD